MNHLVLTIAIITTFIVVFAMIGLVVGFSNRNNTLLSFSLIVVELALPWAVTFGGMAMRTVFHVEMDTCISIICVTGMFVIVVAIPFVGMQFADWEGLAGLVSFLLVVSMVGMIIPINHIDRRNECEKRIAGAETEVCGDYVIIRSYFCHEELEQGPDVFTVKSPLLWTSQCIHCGEDISRHYDIQRPKQIVEEERAQRAKEEFDWYPTAPY